MLVHLICSRFWSQKSQIQVNVSCPGVMVIKGGVHILPGVFKLEYEWFEYLKINRRFFKGTVFLSPVRKVFYLLVASLGNKDLLKWAISEPSLQCYCSWISPITDFYLIAIFSSIGHTFCKINLKSNLPEMDWILRELRLGEPFALKKGFAPDINSSFDALNFLSWLFSQLGSPIMSRPRPGSVELLKSCWVCMDFPAALLCIPPAPASASSSSISQKKFTFHCGEAEGDEGACSP